MNWRLLENSVLVAGFTTVIAVVLGFAAALRMATATAGWRRVMMAATLITLALPPFLLVNHWLELFGATGAWKRWLPVPLFSLGGAVGVLSLMLWPISALLILGAWDRVEAGRWEFDARLRRFALIRWILWPAARSAAGLAALLTFVLAFNQFSVPVILQVPVYSEELWLALTARLNSAGAWSAAWPLIVAPALFVAVWRREQLRWPREDNASSARSLGQALGPAWRRGTLMTTVVVLGLSLVLPLISLVASSRTWTELPGLLSSSRHAIRNSFLIAAITSIACTGLGLGLMHRRIPACRWVLWLFFFAPGVLLAKAMTYLLGGTVLYGTMAFVLMTFAVRYLGVAWTGAGLAWSGMDPRLLEHGRLEGARGWTLFRHYAWPQLARPASASAYVVYLLALWDVETLALIYPPGGETLGLRIFDMLHYGHASQVNSMCVVLLALAVAPFILWPVLRWTMNRGQ